MGDCDADNFYDVVESGRIVTRLEQRSLPERFTSTFTQSAISAQRRNSAGYISSSLSLLAQTLLAYSLIGHFSTSPGTISRLIQYTETKTAAALNSAVT